eukprot:24843-Rhodomonas_salina.1
MKGRAEPRRDAKSHGGRHRDKETGREEEGKGDAGIQGNRWHVSTAHRRIRSTVWGLESEGHGLGSGV